jgi:sugar O-acyltransferase (sialic acid O-acetyltransferase NeuD family)
MIIVGAGGFGNEVFQYARDASGLLDNFRIKGFLDDDLSLHGQLPAPLLGTPAAYQPDVADRFVVSVGDSGVRERIVHDLGERGAKFISLVHPTAYVAATASIGAGCIVGPFCALGDNARVGDHVIMTWYASTGHGTEIGPFSMLSPHAVVNGGATLDSGVFLGTHASINPLVNIGAWTKVAAGSVVYESVPVGCLASGNPAIALPMSYDQSRLPIDAPS